MPKGRRDGRPGLLAVADRLSRATGGEPETSGRFPDVREGRPDERRPDLDLLDGLERLAALRAAGALDDDEYAAAKRRLLT
ncbi:SHOCT domain-containing protein [Agromyces protaetiae]|nr:SHOCT domain-containing protein [Agromyces protaetiae]